MDYALCLPLYLNSGDDDPISNLTNFSEGFSGFPKNSKQAGEFFLHAP